MTPAKFKLESGAQLLARLTKKTEISNFYQTLFENGLQNNDSVEISYNTTSTSCLLTDIISEALLSNKPNLDRCVLLFNTVGQFSYESLIITLRIKIDACLNRELDAQSRQTEVDKLLHKSLNNLFVLEIYDATQFYTTIHNLDNVLIQHPHISFLVFDTLTAFYWTEQGFKITKMDFYIKNLLRMIQKICKEYKLILFYTKPGYFSSSKDTDSIEKSDVTDGVNYKVQLVDNGDKVYQVNVKTLTSYYSKCFNTTDDLRIQWQS